MANITGLNLLIAILGFIAFIIPLGEYVLDKKRKITFKGMFLLVVGLGVMLATLKKSTYDEEYASTNKQNIQNLNDSLASLTKSNRKLLIKLDTANAFLKKLEILGVKRDSIKNTPIITKTFTNNIGSVGTINQY